MITIYTKPNCSFCVNAKDHLKRNEIVFEEIDVMQDMDSLNFLRSQGHSTVPQFYVGQKLLMSGGSTSIMRHTKEQIIALHEDRLGGGL